MNGHGAFAFVSSHVSHRVSREPLGPELVTFLHATSTCT